MSGNTFGRLFCVTTFGESHGEALGVIIDGVPAKVKLDVAFIQSEMDRRKPGGNSLGTKRVEDDEIIILSGVLSGLTTGAPLAIMVKNKNQNSKDYSDLENLYRPGHADYTYEKKYGIRDVRGGGRSSGRETLSRVIAGAVAKLCLKHYGISINAGTVQVKDVKAETTTWLPPFDNELSCPDKAAYEKMRAVIESAREEQDSVGGVIECRIAGVMPGLGSPCFDKLDARLSSAFFSIGAVKGVEFGEGFHSATLYGSENNDQMSHEKTFLTNHSGGILGGISNGNEIIARIAFKPTPSISKPQKTIDKEGNDVDLSITGRHDPCIVPRAVVVVEAMAAITLLDELLIWSAYRE